MHNPQTFSPIHNGAEPDTFKTYPGLAGLYILEPYIRDKSVDSVIYANADLSSVEDVRDSYGHNSDLFIYWIDLNGVAYPPNFAPTMPQTRPIEGRDDYAHHYQFIVVPYVKAKNDILFAHPMYNQALEYHVHHRDTYIYWVDGEGRSYTTASQPVIP